MMTQLQFKEKPEETNKKIVEGIIICIECGSPNTTILTQAIYCRDCRKLKLFGKKNLPILFHKMEIQKYLK